MRPFVVPTRFTAIDAVSPTVKTMTANVNNMAMSMETGIARQEKLFRKLTPALGHATKQLLAYGSAGSILAGLGLSGKAIMDYETAQQSLQAVTGVSNEQMAVFRKQIEETAAVTKKSAIDVTGSFEVVGSMMSQYLDNPEALNQVTRAGITLSKASRTDLVPSLENLTSIMNQFDIGANKAADTVDRITAGEVVGSLRTAQLSEALQEYGASAFSANVTLAESVALGEALAKQMKTDKIGVGARNILTVMDSAKGLDKKARRDLHRAGVDMHVLMDRSRTLSERLHELSKISGDATKITSVFGKENKTAAQVIFNQLATYDEYVSKIQTISVAEQQAAINSKTLKTSVETLKNTWINYITTSSEASTGLSIASKSALFLADNMDRIVSIGIHVIGGFALWKGALIGARIATTGLNVALGIQNAMMGASIGLLEGNIVAQQTAIMVKRSLGVATEVLAGNFGALNAVMAANPALFIVAGVVALTGAIYLLNKRQEEVNETYRKQLDLQIEQAIKNQKKEVDQLAESYKNMGYEAKTAYIESLKMGVFRASEREGKARSERDEAFKTMQSAEEANAWNPFYSYSGSQEATDYYEKNQALVAAMAAKGSAVDQVMAASKSGILDKGMANSMLNQKTGPVGLTRTQEMDKKVTDSFLPAAQQWKPGQTKILSEEDLQKLKDAMKVTIEFKNAPAGMVATTGRGGIATSSSY